MPCGNTLLSALTEVVNPDGRQYKLNHIKVMVEAIAARIKPPEFYSKVHREMQFNLVMHDPDPSFNATA